MLFRPICQGDGNELRAIIHSQSGRVASPGDDALQDPDDPWGRQIQVDLDGQHLPVKIIDHVKRPEPPATEQAVAHEVHGPAVAAASQHLEQLAEAIGWVAL